MNRSVTYDGVSAVEGPKFSKTYALNDISRDSQVSQNLKKKETGGVVRGVTG